MVTQFVRNLKVRRTVPVKLDMTDEQADLLHETIDEFLWAANYVVDAAWDGEWVKPVRRYSTR